MGLKFLDLTTGLPHFWSLILGKIESHNSSAIAHGDIRDEIESLETTVSGKVDAVSGKGLSTNDYTAAEKTKLAGIAAGANKTIVDSEISSASTNPVQNKVVYAQLAEKANTTITDSLSSSISTLNTKVSTAATTSAMGMMSAADKTKLDGIATGATKITVDSSLSSTSTNPVQNKVINTALDLKVDSSTYSTKVSSLESSITNVSDALTAFKATKGAASGIAPLNESSKIDSTYLPSYVDDVLEYSGKSNFPSTGETGKIYVDTSANLTYRWSGTAYVEISPSLALGTTSSTAYRGDLGATAYAHAVTNKGTAFSSGLYKITTNSEGHVTAATAVEKNDLTNLGVMDASSVIPISQGGTGATDADAALVNLGISTEDQVWGGTKTFTDGIDIGTRDEEDALIGVSMYMVGSNFFMYNGSSGIVIYNEEETDENNISAKLMYREDAFDNYAIFHSGITIPIASGGTGATTASGALTNLGISTDEQTWGGKKTFTDGIGIGTSTGEITSGNGNLMIRYDLNSIQMYSTGITDEKSIENVYLTYSPDFLSKYAIFHSGMQIPTSNIASGALTSLVSADATSQAANTAQLRNISVTTDEVTEGTTELAAGQILVVVEE